MKNQESVRNHFFAAYPDKEFNFLGKGQSASVWRFENKVIKFYHDPSDVNGIFLDAPILNRLQGDDSPYLTIYEEKEKEYVVTDYFHGDTLKQLGYQLHDLAHFPASLLGQLIYAIEYALERGIYPKDLHLDNLMLSKDGLQLKIIDVGEFRFINDKFKPFIAKKFKDENAFYNFLTDAYADNLKKEKQVI